MGSCQLPVPLLLFNNKKPGNCGFMLIRKLRVRLPFLLKKTACFQKQLVFLEKESFLLLLDLLDREGDLKRSFKICAGQKLMIFIHILVGHSNKQTTGRWQHSGRTISIVIHEVAAAFMSCQESFFLIKRAGDPPSTYSGFKSAEWLKIEEKFNSISGEMKANRQQMPNPLSRFTM